MGGAEWEQASESTRGFADCRTRRQLVPHKRPLKATKGVDPEKVPKAPRIILVSLG
jgi:hypothetical protein